MDDTKLILVVEKYNVLYDPRNTFYKDVKRKEKAWKEIASAVGATVAECKRRWKVLRDLFVKHKKEKNPPSGSAGGTVRQWKYDKAMSFLLPHVQPRSSRSTLQLKEDVVVEEEEEEEEEEVEEAMDLRAIEEDVEAAGSSGHSSRSATPLFPLQRSSNPNPPSRVQPLISEPQPPKCTRVRRRASVSPSAEQQLLDIITQPTHAPSPHVPTPGEEMYYFALSLVPQLNRLSRGSQVQAKLHILTYLAGLEAQEGQLASSAPPATSSQHQPHPSGFHPYYPTPNPRYTAPPTSQTQHISFMEDLTDPSIPPNYHKFH